MFDPAGLVWTSREEVTSVLLSALDAPPSLATTAMDLCCDVSPPSAAPALLAVARARDRPYWVRVYALRAHARAGARLRDEVLESFFAECLWSRGPSPHGDAASGLLELRDVLAVVKTPAHERIAMRWLARSSPDVGAEALVAIATSHPPMAPQTRAWLADEWLAREGRGCSPENHRAVEFHVFRSRRAAAREGTVTSPRLPARERHALMGHRSLRRLVHRAVVDRSAQLTREDFTPAAEPIAARYRDALDVLRGWRDGPALVTGLLRGVALDPRVRADLVRALLKADPTRAIELVAARPDADDNHRALRVVLTALAGSGPQCDSDTSGPRVPDEVAKGAAARALAFQALRMTRDEAARYLAVGAIEATGEPRGWSVTLRALTGCAAPLVRVRALASLARTGDRDAESQLASAAVDARRVEVRAEALRALGALPSAGDHLALFDRTLSNDHATFGDDALDRPALEQAALAVARVGGRDAMTVLLRRAFGPVTNAALSAMKAGLRVGVMESHALVPFGHDARIQRVAEEEGGWLSRWSPLAATRYGRFGE